MRIKNNFRIQTPENIVKKAVKDYLSLCGYFHFPLRAGLGSFPGLPDRIAIKFGIVLFIEVKSASGKLSEAQKFFRAQIQARGRLNAYYIIVRQISDLMDAIKNINEALSK